jgi:SAM-dependent methyltransferase
MNGIDTRVVAPEWLDALPVNDPRAERSRADLRRLNRLMNHGRILAAAFQELRPNGGVARVIELGAGDGTLLAGMAERLGASWRGTNAILVDRLNAMRPEVPAVFERIGWRIEFAACDALQWLRSAGTGSTDIICANLFLHQFDDETLRAMLVEAARVGRAFVALEPRRSALMHWLSNRLWAIGCGEVSCYDGPVSVRAGFANRDLSALWPDAAGWRLREGAKGWMGHWFCAQRD